MAQFSTNHFRAALSHLLELEGRGAQARLASTQGIDRGYLNAIVKGRKDGSEMVREKIAHYFSMDYEKMLAMGRQLSEVGALDRSQTRAYGKGTLPANGEVCENCNQPQQPEEDALSPDTSEVLLKGMAILESGTSYGELLKSLITTFYDTIGTQQVGETSRTKVDDLENKLSILEDLLRESLKNPV